ncbi:AI-2E family transporter [Methanofollis fontis]|nr:AI-2E family transporter [Methanofollis fontis]
MYIPRARWDLFIVALTAIIVTCATIAFWPLINPLIVGISVAVVLMPLQRRLSEVVAPWISSAVITISVFVIGFLLIVTTLTILSQNAGYLAGMITTIIEWIRSMLSGEFTALIPINAFQEVFSSLITDIQIGIINALALVPMAIIKIIIFFLTVYFLLITGDRIWQDILGVVPVRSMGSFSLYSRTVSDTLYSILVVHISIAFITFFLALPFFWLLGYDHVLFFSILSALFAIVPVLGPVFLILFLGVYALAIGDWRALALLALIGYPVVAGMPDLFLRPILMGQRVEIPPVLIFMAFFGGMAVMGVMGFILGPLFVALLLAGYRIMVKEFSQTRNGGSG